MAYLSMCRINLSTICTFEVVITYQKYQTCVQCLFYQFSGALRAGNMQGAKTQQAKQFCEAAASRTTAACTYLFFVSPANKPFHHESVQTLAA